MSEPHVVGVQPWFPWPLSAWRWWTDPVPAERLAALRIGVAVVLLIDVLGYHLPFVQDFFGRDSLGAPDVFVTSRMLPAWPWSLLASVESVTTWRLILLAWAVAAVLLGLGVYPRLAAAVAWYIGGSVTYVLPYVFNSGDAVRNLLLFYLMLCPSGAVWSVMRRHRPPGPVYVAAWPLRLLFFQMSLIYCVSGLSKLNADWWSGEVIYRILADPFWARWSSNDLGLPYPMTQALTWFTVLWEITFPLTVAWRRTRPAALVLGVFFHLGTGVTMRLVLFPLNMMCFYLPLLPWERWLSRCTPMDKAAEVPALQGEVGPTG